MSPTLFDHAMIYECEKCGAALRAGDHACAGCGDAFETPVPREAPAEEAPATRPNKRARRPSLSAVAAVVLLALLSVSAGLSYRWRSSAAAPRTASSPATVAPILPLLAPSVAAKPEGRAARRARRAARLAQRDRAKRKSAGAAASFSPSYFSPDETRYWQTLRGQAARLAACARRFSALCARPDFDGAVWQAGMQSAGAELKAMTVQGADLPEPPQCEGAGQEYHLAMTDCDYVATRLPGVLEQRDGETLRGCARYLQDAQGHLHRAQALVGSLKGPASKNLLKDAKGGAG